VPDGGIAATSDGDGGLFADCGLAGGCIADCSPPADDPIATGHASFDLYDGCILAAMRVAGMTEAWEGQLLKRQADNESGITPLITTNDDNCGGQNCGSWAISAGSVSGDSPPGPCGSSSVDPFTGQVDYSHSYGLFQETPACEGTFLQKTLPAGYTCTPTTKADNIPFDSGITFYCESATSLGVSTPTGTNKGYINAVQNTADPLYATSIFNRAYQIYVYLDYTWGINFQGANAKANGCTQMQQWYLSLAYWLTGNATTSCNANGSRATVRSERDQQLRRSLQEKHGHIPVHDSLPAHGYTGPNAHEEEAHAKGWRHRCREAHRRANEPQVKQ
jgi:hypothetical protein